MGQNVRFTITASVVIAATAVLCSACGGGAASPAASSTVTTTVTVTASASPSPGASPSKFAPNVGVNALKLGQTRHGQDIDTTVYEAKRPFVSTVSGREPTESGQEWVRVRAKECLHPVVSKELRKGLQVSWNDFSAQGAGGGTFPASGAWADFPTPQFPLFGP